MADRKVVIRKYENRRLYDTTNSRYVNLDEVAQMVRDGVDLQVVDAASGEDITRLVLTQIIVEQAKEPNSVFPLDMLRQMVAASGRASQESALKYMKAMFDVYQNAYRAFPAVPPFDFMQNMMVPPNVPPAATRPPGADNGKQETARAGTERASSDEVSELKRRLEELESRIAKEHRGHQTKRSSKVRNPKR